MNFNRNISENPLISIITPCFNSARYLSSTIASVLSQTYQHFEWIVINDGSTDETENILKSLTDNRVRYYSQENRGQSFASNFGISIARGKYIKFLDADDIMNSIHLEEQLSRIIDRNDALASCSWGRFYDDNPQNVHFVRESVWMDMDAMTWIKKSLSQQYDMMALWVWLIPKNIIDRTGGFNEHLDLNNDFEFSLRLLLSSEHVYFAENAKMYYRTGNETLSQRHTEQAFRSAIRATDFAMDYLLKREDSSLIKKLMANRYQEWLFRLYPYYPAIVKEVELKIKQLGGSDREIESGILFQKLSKVLGWKKTKKIQLLLRKIGYRSILYNKTVIE